jgi:hypothetical protein
VQPDRPAAIHPNQRKPGPESHRGR